MTTEPQIVQLPQLATVPDVEIVAAGTWPLSTGDATFTPADLAAAVQASQCPAVGSPVIKIGHTDPRFDGEPAVGRVANMRLTSDGTKLTGDLAGMPAWLAAAMPSAFPNRSIEGMYGYACQIGHQHPFVITGLALLGVTAPGVGVLSSLKDIAALYGVAAAAGETGNSTWNLRLGEVMAGTTSPGPGPAATIEDVRRAYYDNPATPMTYWITEIQLSPLQLIVADEASNLMYRVPVTVDGADVQFGDPVPVQVAYLDAPPPDTAAASAGAPSGRALAVAARMRTFTDDQLMIRRAKIAAAISGTVQSQFLTDLKKDSSTDIAAGIRRLSEWAASGSYPAGTSYTDLKWLYDQCAAELKSRDPNSTAGGNFPAEPAQKTAAAARSNAVQACAALDQALETIASEANASAAAKSGGEPASPQDACPECDGTGKLNANGGSYPCPDCEGTGKIPAKTSASGGLPDPGTPAPDQQNPAGEGPANSGPVSGQCPDCNGTGRTHGTDGTFTGNCPACQGTGNEQTSEKTSAASGDDATSGGKVGASAGHTAGHQAEVADMQFSDDQMAALRQKLCVAADAELTPDQILAAIAAPAVQAGQPGTDVTPKPAAEGAAPATPDTAGGAGQPVQAAADGTIRVDAAAWQEVQRRLAMGEQARILQLTSHRDTTISAAISAGKIPPARREHWEKAWAKDPEGTEQVLASLEPGLIPLQDIGNSGGALPDGDQMPEYNALFGDAKAGR